MQEGGSPGLLDAIDPHSGCVAADALLKVELRLDQVISQTITPRLHKGLQAMRGTSGTSQQKPAVPGSPSQLGLEHAPFYISAMSHDFKEEPSVVIAMTSAIDGER